MKLYSFIFITILFCSFISATQTDLGSVRAGDEVELIQLCATCTYNNISSITFPNKSSALIENVAMTKNGVEYTYLLDGGNTTSYGEYIVNGFGDIDGSIDVWSYTFLVTPNGEELTESRSSLFNFGIIILFVFFVLALIGVFTVGEYKSKFALYWVAHVLFVVGTFNIWQFTSGYGIGYTGLEGIFKVLFYVSITAMFPMLILSLAWIFYIHTMNDDIKKMMERGMDENEAYDRSRRKKRW